MNFEGQTYVKFRPLKIDELGETNGRYGSLFDLPCNAVTTSSLPDVKIAIVSPYFAPLFRHFVGKNPLPVNICLAPLRDRFTFTVTFLRLTSSD